MKTCDLRNALITELGEYTKRNFSEGKVKFNIYQQGDNAKHQIINISCLNLKLECFWSGEWQSIYTLKDGVLTGSLSLTCHYFE